PLPRVRRPAGGCFRRPCRGSTPAAGRNPGRHPRSAGFPMPFGGLTTAVEPCQGSVGGGLHPYGRRGAGAPRRLTRGGDGRWPDRLGGPGGAAVPAPPLRPATAGLVPADRIGPLADVCGYGRRGRGRPAGG